MSERLQKFLARAGVASRRHAEGLITAGRVNVNNQPVTELGTKVEPTNLVTVDGKLVTAPETTSWYLLHKPPGVVTTLSDPEGRPTVAGLLQGVEQRVFPVGRLDWDAEGALLLTNDGATGHRLLHPSFEVPRTYLVKVKGTPTDETLARLLEGVRLEDGPARALRAERFEATEKNTWLLLQVGEGRPHLVKRLCAAVGHPVVRLFRPAQASISVAGLQPGELRPLTAEEVHRVEAVAAGGSVPEPAPFLPPRRHGRAGDGDEAAEDFEPGAGAAPGTGPGPDEARRAGPRAGRGGHARGAGARPGARPGNRPFGGGRGGFERGAGGRGPRGAPSRARGTFGGGAPGAGRGHGVGSLGGRGAERGRGPQGARSEGPGGFGGPRRSGGRPNEGPREARRGTFGGPRGGRGAAPGGPRRFGGRPIEGGRDARARNVRWTSWRARRGTRRTEAVRRWTDRGWQGRPRRNVRWTSWRARRDSTGRWPRRDTRRTEAIRRLGRGRSSSTLGSARLLRPGA